MKGNPLKRFLILPDMNIGYRDKTPYPKSTIPIIRP